MSFVEAILVALVGVVVPGVAGVLQPGSSRAPHVGTRFLAGAALLGLATMVLRRATGLAPGPLAYGGILLALSLSAGFIGVRRGGRLPRVAREPWGWVLACVAFALAAWSGLRVVPPLEDQDMEVQGTAYGLVTDLQPLCLTNRGTVYFLAHPPLLHVYNATTLTLSGDLDAVRPAYDAAVAERAKPAGAPGSIFALRPDRTIAWTRDVYGGFLRDPALLGTRAPNFVLAALLALLVFRALRTLGARSSDAALLALVQMTLPEIFVRSGYGGYFALSAVTFLAAGWLAAVGARGEAVLGGTLAMLANQKSVIVAAASCALGFARARWLVGGFILGGALFAAWGLALAPQEFVRDHLVDHGVARFGVARDAPGPGAVEYPSRAGLWVEFARHFGWVWCACVAAGLAVAIGKVARRRAVRDGTGAMGEAESLLMVAVGWIVIGAILFTWTDWRQTKHLAKLVPAMTLVVGALLAGAPRPVRLLLRAALGVSLAWNVMWIARLARDFGAMSPTPLW